MLSRPACGTCFGVEAETKLSESRAVKTLNIAFMSLTKRGNTKSNVNDSLSNVAGETFRLPANSRNRLSSFLSVIRYMFSTFFVMKHSYVKWWDPAPHTGFLTSY